MALLARAGTPIRAARRTTVPCRVSSSMRRPVTRSWCSEEYEPRGRLAAKSSCCAMTSSPSGTPWPRRARRPRRNPLEHGPRRCTPERPRVTAGPLRSCRPWRRYANFVQSTTPFRRDVDASLPALGEQLLHPDGTPAVQLAEQDASRSAGVRDDTWFDGRREDEGRTADHRLGPITAANFSSLSTPFWGETTALSSFSNGPRPAAASSASYDFTQKSTRRRDRCRPSRRSPGPSRLKPC